MKDIEHALRQRTTAEVRFDRLSRALYSTDASIYEIEPQGVVIPRTVEDLQATVEIAGEYGIPLTPRGGGTSIVGNAIGSGIILDCSKHLNSVLEVNAEEAWARVQPGVILDSLNRHLESHDLFFGPDVAPSNRANIGGMIGNNSSGAHSILYGKTIDHVDALDIVLSTAERVHCNQLTAEQWDKKCSGETFEGALYRQVDALCKRHRSQIERRFPKILRRVAGYNLDEFLDESRRNLSRLIVGSEGTLGVVAEAKLGLVERLRHSVLAVIHFDNLFTALDSVSDILNFEPAAVELLDDNIINMTRGTQEYARRMNFIEGQPAALLLVEFRGNDQAQLSSQLDKFSAHVMRKRFGYHCLKLKEPEGQANVWFVRKAGLGLLMGSRAARKPVGFVEDSAVAPEKLPEYIRRFDEIVREHHTEAAYYAHASVGCLHIRPKLNLRDDADVTRMADIAAAVSDLALEFDGTISGEHGDGIAHSCWNEKMFGPEIYQAFREIKGAFDPQNIFNPGKIVDAPFLTEHFRRESIDLPQLTPFFKYDTGGMAAAVDMCNGNGACRKLDSGTMCPSFMVTRDEIDTTRGRANALRAVLNGTLPAEAFTGRELFDVMDLCIACKGCKGECPSNVDMAKLKYEFLHRYHQVHGASLRDRLFAQIHRINKLTRTVAPLVNWSSQRLPLRWLLHRFLGIDCHRRLPPQQRTTFESWFSRRKRPADAGVSVILFHDTFTNFNYPEVGRAAVRVLEAAGCKIELATGRVCCGRPMLSKGLLDEAREAARHNVALLLPRIKRGAWVVGLEPSCILTFREEYPDMLDGPEVADVAARTLTFEEFVCRPEIRATLEGRFAAPSASILLHGHCHQKALVGMNPSTELLKLLPDAEVEVIDSGCCGMAGSFGFESEHYQISLAMAHRRLLPAVQAFDSGGHIVASGVSCRQQLEHGSGRRALHPAEILAGHLKT